MEALPLKLLNFHGSVSIDDVIDTMKYSVENFDIQVIILDNLQFMMGVNATNRYFNKFDYQDQIIHKLRSFATEFNVNLTLVIHPRKTEEAMNINSIFGSAKATQEADNVLILQSYKGIRIIDIAKNRFDGTLGKAVIAMDKQTNRFIELTVEEFNDFNDNNTPVEKIIQNRIIKYGSSEKIQDIKIESKYVDQNKISMIVIILL